MKRNLALATFFLFIVFPLCLLAQDYCLEFDGLNDYVYITNSTLISTDKLTVSCWIYHFADSFGNFINTGNQNDYGMYIDGNHRVAFNLHTDAGVQFLFSNTVLSGEGWYHLAGVYNGSQHQIYFNGVLDNEVTSSGTPSTPQEDNLTFGTYWLNGAYGDFFRGRLDDVAIWERALTSSEIQSAMVSPSLVPAVGLRGFWDFDEGAGSLLGDNSGNGNDGTIYGAMWVLASQPVESVESSFGRVKALFR